MNRSAYKHLLGFYDVNRNFQHSNVKASPSQLDSKAIKMVLFHTEWSHFCVELMPKWKDAKEISEKSLLGVEWIELDGDSEDVKEIYKKYGMRGFPTICKISNDTITMFQEERSVENLIKFATE